MVERPPERESQYGGPTRSASSRPRRGLFWRWREFWARLSDGLAVDQLWAQLRTETQAGYRLYQRDAAAPQPRRRRARAFFWAVVMKLSPARRILLLLALLLLLISSWSVLGVGILLALLALEVADRVMMKRDLEIAREIQTWLLPEAPPQVPGAEVAFVNCPAQTISGDFYDAFWRGPAVLLTVADVAGKGVPAALLTATYQASLRTLAAGPAGLEEIAAGLNQYACAHSAGGSRFTTAFVAEFDPATGGLRYCNAGQNAPMLRRADGSVERLDRGGLPFGILPATLYECARTALAPGDRLLVFTDGVTETFNPAGEDYGEARLLQVLRSADGAGAEALLDRLIADCAAFRGNARQQDDITCLALCRPPAP